jgi:alpha-D-ribose 1-methylphosphonate 5-triphosphate synthase subunit PhnH
MNSIDIEKHNRETFRKLLDTLSMPGSCVKIEKLFDSYLLSIASVLLYSEVSFTNRCNEDFTMIEAITNAKQENIEKADYIFCNSLEKLFGVIKKGTHLSPEYSATIICEVDSFEGLTLTLQGAGVDGKREEKYPVDATFVKEFMDNNKNYPLGNEIYFLNKTTGELKAISRTTKLEIA